MKAEIFILFPHVFSCTRNYWLIIAAHSLIIGIEHKVSEFIEVDI